MAIGRPTSPLATPAVPTAITAAPVATSDVAVQVSARRDCHQLPTDHATVDVARTTPAATDRPRTPVSIRGTKPSTAKNEADNRNADAAAAGIPGRARNVPFGTMRARAGKARARAIPAGHSPILAGDGVVRPLRKSPAPSVSC